ncbi:hypothetical protein [Urbifossiella limnaea]|uniref:Uncharacterized protein n=1 Tax=Urbifossiella limnaea TaxID=2528023 RepID=A0A517XLW6_9BACT|nr:hypothetical protein [Urbifossiella limnaea]QDU18503.1 hypothetical protein ETAA1_03930 [Urbifossiella limnaea]
MPAPDRRAFLSASALAFLDGLPAVRADEARVVRLDADAEPLVRLIEDTPRPRLLEEVGARVKAGLPYRDVLAALFLAGVRNVRPRPSVGFKFHAVLVVNSAHLASLAGPDRERWLPLFWALDSFKGAQADNQRESGWRMGPVDEAKVPPPHRAAEALAAALDAWDVDAADAAAAGVARGVGAAEAFELFARFGCRDFRDIGHKAIFVANAFRTLQTIGWPHAEPVLRSLAFALLAHEGTNPAKRDGDPDRPGRRNREQVAKIRPEWLGGRADPAAGADVLAAVRAATADELSDKVVSLLNGGVGPAAVWDGLFAGAGELLMRQPGIVGLHTLTTLNALRYAYQASGVDATRRLLLLQAAAFLPLFRTAMVSRGKVGVARIDALEPVAGGDVAAVFETLSKDRAAAAGLALGLLRADPANARRLTDAGRRLVFLKGTDSHDYKFSSAVLEDHAALGPAWRDRFLAASLFWLKGSAGPDAPVVARARAALA